jgi:GDP-D-mannose dehydratase
VESDPALFRPAEIQVSSGDPSAARESVSWQAKMHMSDVAAALVQHALERR